MCDMTPLFKKKEIFQVKSKPYEPDIVKEPTTANEYQRRGMAYYARKQFDDAERELQKAISLDNSHLDSYYCLGMVYKAIGRKEESTKSFTRALSLISSDTSLKTTQIDMLRRLAKGHINEMNQGDWNLEKEIWKHKD